MLSVVVNMCVQLYAIIITNLYSIAYIITVSADPNYNVRLFILILVIFVSALYKHLSYIQTFVIFIFLILKKSAKIISQVPNFQDKTLNSYNSSQW